MHSPTPRPFLVQLLVLLAVLGVFWQLRQAGLLTRPAVPTAGVVTPVSDADIARMRPREEPHDSFTGSTACVKCHRHQHSTWSNSWHRTMTQVTTLTNFMGSLDELVVSENIRYRFYEKDGLPWFHVENPPDHFNPTPGDRHDYPIVMSTGSHLMQLGWFPIGHSDTLGLLPLAYLKEDRRWVPHASIFLQPPSSRSATRVGIWNDGCIRCHATGPESRRLQGDTFNRSYGFNTRAAEFGIACESCHGPGEAHVHLHRDRSAAPEGIKDPIVNPANLDHQRASEICGACHGDLSPRAPFRATPHHLPGRPLTERYHVNEPPLPAAKTTQPDDNYHGDGTTLYWPDGMARVSGAEFSGFRISRCYTEGKISCLDCHSLHQSGSDPRPTEEWAADMLHSDALTDTACLKCHTAEDYATVKHTMHAAASSGSRCYNCHMPHTSYGLLKAIRSHTISSPSVNETLAAGRLNACNLCHLDRTLEWTGQQLESHYGHKMPPVEDKHRQVSAALLHALTGDAGQRALVAWSMAWPPARQASRGADWIPPHLAQLLKDPYTAVRYITGQSLKQYGFPTEGSFDYLASEEERAAWAEKIVAEWKTETTGSPGLLITPAGRLDRDRVARLIGRRDDSDIALLE